jgi:heptosyltransferase III
MTTRAGNAEPGRSRTLEQMLPAGAGQCLFLAMRHMGDALLWCAFLRTLREARPGLRIDILGRPQLQVVFAANCDFDEYLGIELPLFGHHRRDGGAIGNALQTLARVRRERYDVALNLIGDFRENLIGMLSGARWNVAPVWARGHLFRHKMNPSGAQWLTNAGVEVPAALESYYASMEFMASALGMPKPQWHNGRPRAAGKRGAAQAVALHPGASHPSKRWPAEKWKQLIRGLADRGYTVAMFCAPGESGDIRKEYAEEIRTVGMEILAEGVGGFMAALGSMDLLVGMDSLSAHAAYACGVPSVVLFGSSPPAVMAPPGAASLSAGAQCPHFPCYYSYPCRGRAGEYICSGGIEVAEVLSAVERLAKRTGSGALPQPADRS